MQKTLLAYCLLFIISNAYGMQSTKELISFDEEAMIQAAIKATTTVPENNMQETTFDVSELLAEIEQDEEKIVYRTFFDACLNGNIGAINAFIASHPEVNLDYQNEHGTTPLLHAATWGEWSAVWHLRACGAHINIKDHYGQSLFSKAVYGNANEFKKLLTYLSLDEINRECKAICLNRDMVNLTEINFGHAIPKIKNALKNKKTINNVLSHGNTTLQMACIFQMTPLIIQLLENGADLDMTDRWNSSAYNDLTDHQTIPFVVREAFNKGSCIPAALICYFFEVLKITINSDIANYIKQLYLKALSESLFFESPKARIWKYVAQDACALLGMAPADLAKEKRCLIAILLAPQNILTKVNIQLALADK